MQERCAIHHILAIWALIYALRNTKIYKIMHLPCNTPHPLLSYCKYPTDLWRKLHISAKPVSGNLNSSLLLGVEIYADIWNFCRLTQMNIVCLENIEGKSCNNQGGWKLKPSKEIHHEICRYFLKLEIYRLKKKLFT